MTIVYFLVIFSIQISILGIYLLLGLLIGAFFLGLPYFLENEEFAL
jgi:hypothetical protein